MAKQFVIHKGIDNEYMFTIKKNGSIEAIVIAPSDTFVFNLMRPKTSEVIYTTNAVVMDAINGRIKVVIPSAATTGLVMEVGDRCDYYNRKAVYRANIVCSTVDNGNFIAELEKIYVG